MAKEEVKKVEEEIKKSSEAVLEDIEDESEKKDSREPAAHSPDIWTRSDDSSEKFPASELEDIKQEIEEDLKEMQADIVQQDNNDDVLDSMQEAASDLVKAGEEVDESLRKINIVEEVQTSTGSEMVGNSQKFDEVLQNADESTKEKGEEDSRNTGMQMEDEGKHSIESLEENNNEKHETSDGVEAA